MNDKHQYFNPMQYFNPLVSSSIAVNLLEK